MRRMDTEIAAVQAMATGNARSQKGNVLIEFALILPVFLALLFGMITFSMALYNKTVLTMATREGARAGAKYVSGTNTDDTRKSNASTAALNACGGLISFGADVTPTITSSISNNILKVTCNFPYTGLYIFSNSIQISAQSSMNLEK